MHSFGLRVTLLLHRDSRRRHAQKVIVILLNEWILPIGGVASGRVCPCSLRSRLVYNHMCSITLSGPEYLGITSLCTFFINFIMFISQQGPAACQRRLI